MLSEMMKATKHHSSPEGFAMRNHVKYSLGGIWCSVLRTSKLALFQAGHLGPGAVLTHLGLVWSFSEFRGSRSKLASCCMRCWTSQPNFSWILSSSQSHHSFLSSQWHNSAASPRGRASSAVALMRVLSRIFLPKNYQCWWPAQSILWLALI